MADFPKLTLHLSLNIDFYNHSLQPIRFEEMQTPQPISLQVYARGNLELFSN